jgi:hypothetical protein
MIIINSCFLLNEPVVFVTKDINNLIVCFTVQVVDSSIQSVIDSCASLVVRVFNTE